MSLLVTGGELELKPLSFRNRFLHICPSADFANASVRAIAQMRFAKEPFMKRAIGYESWLSNGGAQVVAAMLGDWKLVFDLENYLCAELSVDAILSTTGIRIVEGSRSA